jgi:hypothetical protein
LLGQPLIDSLQNSSAVDGRLAALAQEQRSNNDDHLPLRGCPSSEAAIPRVCVVVIRFLWVETLLFIF